MARTPVRVVQNAAEHGGIVGAPGVLNLDGFEYAQTYDLLQFNFDAVGSQGFSNANNMVVAQDDLTLHLVDADFTMNSAGPVSTRAVFNIWNMNETKFSGTTRCLTCWNQSLLANYEWPNNFRLANLQTFVGKARIDGLASEGCNSILNRETVDAALLGVSMRELTMNGQQQAKAGRTADWHGSRERGDSFMTGCFPPRNAANKWECLVRAGRRKPLDPFRVFTSRG